MTALRDALSHWRHEMIRTTGLDAATIEGYAADAGRFVAWLEGQGLDISSAPVALLRP